MTRIFRPHQQAIYNALVRFEAQSEGRRWGANVWAGMGSGKTGVVLTFLDALYNVAGEDRPTLIVGPKRVVQSVWPDELGEWPVNLALSVVTGTPREREAALKRDVPLFAINYDNLIWLSDYLNGHWPFGTVVPDESTKLKGFRVTQGTQRARRLGAVAHEQVRRWINLTGRPAPNGLPDLWGQQWFIDSGGRLGRSFSAFEARWFAWRRPPHVTNNRSVERIALPGADDEIVTKLADCTVTVVNPLGVDKPRVNIVEVTLPKAAAVKYREMERELYAEFNGVGVEAFSAASKTVKCLQLASGAIYTDPEGREWAEVHSAKLDALADIQEEAAGMPLLVAYQWRHDLVRLRKAFPHARVLDDNPQTIRDWNEGRIPMLFAHPQSAGHGLNLQHGSNTLVFFGLWWDLDPHDQILERIGPTRQKQSGYDREVVVHYIVAKGTMDRNVLRRLQTKASVQDALLDWMAEQRGLVHDALRFDRDAARVHLELDKSPVGADGEVHPAVQLERCTVHERRVRARDPDAERLVGEVRRREAGDVGRRPEGQLEPRQAAQGQHPSG
jgi:hypothetical protein